MLLRYILQSPNSNRGRSVLNHVSLDNQITYAVYKIKLYTIYAVYQDGLDDLFIYFRRNPTRCTSLSSENWIVEYQAKRIIGAFSVGLISGTSIKEEDYGSREIKDRSQLNSYEHKCIISQCELGTNNIICMLMGPTSTLIAIESQSYCIYQVSMVLSSL